VCGLDQPRQALTEAPVPQEAQPVSQAVIRQFGPARLGPGQQVQRRVQQRRRCLARAGRFAQRVEPRRRRVILRQGLLHRRPPGRRVFGKRSTPAPDRARRGRSVGRALPRDLRPRCPAFVARDDDRLNDDQQIVAEAQQKTGQQREGAVTRRAIPALDADAIGVRRVQRLAPVEAMPDEGLGRLTLRTLRRTGEDHVLEMRQVLVDSSSDVGYNDHAVGARPSGRATTQRLGVGRLLSSGWERIAYTPFRVTPSKRPPTLDGPADTGHRRRHLIQPRCLGSLSKISAANSMV